MNNSFTRAFLLLLLPATIIFAASKLHIVRGSGNVISESWQVSRFDGITLSGSGDVILTQGGEESLLVETDDNVMEYIKVDVADGTLHIGFKDGVNLISTTRLVFHVGVDDLSGLTILGSGHIETDRLEAENMYVEIYGSGHVQVEDIMVGNFEADIYGSGTVQLAGEVDTQDVMINGWGEYLAEEVCSERINLWVNGAGYSTICALDMLDVIITGSGSVSYYNQPTVEFSGFGSGSLFSLGNH